MGFEPGGHAPDLEIKGLPLALWGRMQMVEYRRGIESQRKNDFWHWQPDCLSFPLKAFSLRKDTPSDDDLCSKCAGLSVQG